MKVVPIQLSGLGDPNSDVVLRETAGNTEPTAHERSLARVPGLVHPSLKELIDYARRRGTDGVLESAAHLSDSDYVRLRELCLAIGKVKR